MATEDTLGLENMFSSQNDSGKTAENAIELSQNPFSVLADVDNHNGGGNEVFGQDTDWSTVINQSKRKKISSSGASSHDISEFRNMKTDEKLLVMYTEMSKHSRMEKKIDQCLQLHNRVNDLEENMSSVDSRLLLLEYKSLDLESRSRRNNLIFNGFQEEKFENCHDKIRNLFNKLEIGGDVVLDRAHRLGMFKRGAARSIIVAFRDYTDLEATLSNAYKLKDTTYSINRDFPREIAQARKSIWGQYKDLKRQYPENRIRIVYPAKLIKDGITVADKFPMWNKIMSGDRVPSSKTQSMNNGNQISHAPRENSALQNQNNGRRNVSPCDSTLQQPSYAAAAVSGPNTTRNRGINATVAQASNGRSRSTPVGYDSSQTSRSRSKQHQSRSPNRRIREPRRRSQAPRRDGNQIRRPWDTTNLTTTPQTELVHDNPPPASC